MSKARDCITAVVFAAILAATWNGCHRRPAPGAYPEKVDNVILISIDSLRADHVGTYGYHRATSPRIDALGRSGIVFERAYSTTSWTLPAHTAMLTGLGDRVHGVRDHNRKLISSIQPLAETLSREGITTTGFFSGPYLHPTFGLNRGFSTYINCSSVLPDNHSLVNGQEHAASFRDVTNPIILAKLRAWLAGGGPQRRNFLFIHMWDVHYDYKPPAKYVQLFDPGYSGPITGEVENNPQIRPGMNPRDLRHLIALYDGEIRYTDDTVAQILDLLHSAGLLRSAAVFVVADHGDEFLEHGSKGHHATLYEEVLRIPMVLSIPGFRPVEGRIRKIVSLIDIYPTICQLFGVQCRPGRLGNSLLRFFAQGNNAESRDDALADLYLGRFGLEEAALVTERGKIMRWSVGDLHQLGLLLAKQTDQPGIALRPGPGTFTLFFDPDEMRTERRGLVVDGNAAAYGPAVRALQQKLDRRLAAAAEARYRFAQGGFAAPTHIDEQTKERLRALGYLE